MPPYPGFKSKMAAVWRGCMGIKDITLQRMISTVSSLYVRIFYSFLIFIKTSQQPIKQYVHYIWWATHFARVKFLKTLGEYSRIIITLYNMQEKKNQKT